MCIVLSIVIDNFLKNKNDIPDSDISHFKQHIYTIICNINDPEINQSAEISVKF